MMVTHREIYADLRAPGVPDYPSERDRAIELARAVLKQQPDVDGDPLHLLARQLLRALGLNPLG